MSLEQSNMCCLSEVYWDQFSEHWLYRHALHMQESIIALQPYTALLELPYLALPFRSAHSGLMRARASIHECMFFLQAESPESTHWQRSAQWNMTLLHDKKTRNPLGCSWSTGSPSSAVAFDLYNALTKHIKTCTARLPP